MAVLHSEPHSPSRAERVFAEACRGLSQGWHVFFGVEWSRRGAGGAIERSGEMDAVLYHREHGLVVVEVKGGGIRRDGDRWASLGRTGWHPIKDPLSQARESTWFLIHEIKDLVRSRPGQGFPFATWGLCFPDVEKPRDEWLGHDLHPHQILSRRDLERLEPALVAILRLGQGTVRHQAASPDLESALLGRFHPCFELRPPVREVLRDEEDGILQATRHQEQFLRSARSIARLVVEGCAGSGKSVLAADRARLHERDGETVLLLCYNPLLAERWAAQGPWRGVEPRTFHGLADEVLEREGIGLPDDDPEGREQVLERELARLQASGRAPRFDAVVVDEGQDFRSSWWPLVDGFLKEPGTGPLVVFRDRRQDLFHQGGLPPEMPVFHLDRTVRHTRAIADWISRRTGFPLEPDELCPEGEPPVERSWKLPVDQAAFLRDDLGALLADGLEPDRILVVSCRDRESSGLAVLPSGLPIAWSSAPDTWRPGRVNADSVLRTKGLEADVVVVADLGPDTPMERLYTAASRARHRLIVYRGEK